MWQALIVVMIGSFMAMLDATVVNIALPRIITVFNAPVDAAQFVSTGYMIALAIIMPATGYLSDTYGTKRIYLLSMFLFTMGSLLCGLAWSIESLVVFRILQGLGGGMLMPLGMTVIFKTVPLEKRGLVSGRLRPADALRSDHRADGRRLHRRVHRLALHLHAESSVRAARPVARPGAAARDRATSGTYTSTGAASSSLEQASPRYSTGCQRLQTGAGEAPAPSAFWVAAGCSSSSGSSSSLPTRTRCSSCEYSGTRPTRSRP